MAYFSGTVIYSSLIKEVYNPKTFILHAALLHQGFPHCAIFPTAASRRSLGRVSVPMWPINLSVRLPIVALVVHYTHQLANWTRAHLSPDYSFDHQDDAISMMLCGISTSFPVLSPCERQVAHALLTRPPLRYILLYISARLACVRHAASVRPEPGSNSQINYLLESLFSSLKLLIANLLT